GEWYLALGHARAAEQHLRQALADLPGAPLPPDREIRALTDLAQATERQGDDNRAGQAWRQVEAFARAQLDDPRQGSDPRQRLRCLQGLSESYRFQGRRAEAVRRLEQLLGVQEQLN